MLDWGNWMAKNTAIGWCATRQPDGTLKPGHSWNPWMGCSKVSAGCANCYAEREMFRFGKNFNAVTRSKTTFLDPLKWKKPARVFTCSWSDFFHPDADEWRDEAWDIIRKTPHLNYLILTKRPELIATRLPGDWDEEWNDAFSHVWMGVTIEDRKVLESRMVPMMGIPTANLFVSVEPLLGPIDFSPWTDVVDWAIIGGESGRGYRIMKEKWATGIIEQFVNKDIPVYFKQMAGRSPKAIPIPDHLSIQEWPEDTRKAEYL